jgi:hypothetical protein
MVSGAFSTTAAHQRPNRLIFANPTPFQMHIDQSAYFITPALPHNEAHVSSLNVPARGLEMTKLGMESLVLGFTSGSGSIGLRAHIAHPTFSN